MKNLSLISGVNYTKRSEAGTYQFVNNKIPVIDYQTGIIAGYFEDDDTVGVYIPIDNNYNFVQIPLMLGYQIPVSGRVKLSVRAGGSISYFMGAHGSTLNPQTLTIENLNTIPYNKKGTEIMMGAGCTYMLNKRLGIMFEPTYRKFNGSITGSNSYLRITPYSFGLNTSIQFMVK